MTAVTNRFPVRRRIRLRGAAYQAGHCFFVTIGTHERHPWFSLHPELADKVAAIVGATAEQRHAQLYAWCLMPNHLHLLAQDTNIVEFARLVKGRATPPARQFEHGRRLWQRSFFDHGLRHDESLVQVAQYTFENPVRARLVDTPADYKWSGSNVWPDWRTFY